MVAPTITNDPGWRAMPDQPAVTNDPWVAARWPARLPRCSFEVPTSMIIARSVIAGLLAGQLSGLLSKSLFASCEGSRPRGSCEDTTRDGAARGAPSYY